MLREKLEYQCCLRNGEVIHSLISIGWSCGDDCSIKFIYSEKAKRKRELIVVVNNNELKYVVDTVCFDTFAEELTAGR